MYRLVSLLTPKKDKNAKSDGVQNALKGGYFVSFQYTFGSGHHFGHHLDTTIYGLGRCLSRYACEHSDEKLLNALSAFIIVE